MVTNPAYARRLIVERELKNIGYSVAVRIPNAFGHAISEGIDGTVSHITNVLGKGLAAGVFTDKDLRTANLEIAHKAQNAIIEGWRARLPLKSGPYRRGSNPQKDRLSGKLGQTLASSAMVQGTTARSISFLNSSALAENARHWYRVNYGAFGPNVAAIRRPKAYPVTIEGHTIFTLQDPNEPAPNSWLPVRFTFQDKEFFPVQGPADKEGGGHRAALFTDLGYKALSQAVEPAYRKMVFTKFRGGGMLERFEQKNLNIQAIIKTRP